MSLPADLGIIFLARDRYSTAEFSLQAVLSDAARSGAKPHVYIADPGYSAEHVSSLHDIALANDADATFIDVGKYATTNHAWNEVYRGIAEERVLCLENDVNMQPGCLGILLPLIASEKKYQIFAPAVYEPDGVTPHFRPTVASIDRLAGSGTRVELDRGRSEKGDSEGVTRPIDIFERHCFLMSRASALAIGDWDELMFCRTDLDLSLACHAAGLHAALVEAATVQLSGEGLEQEDVAFYDYRWNEHRVMRSNERLIAKWQLIGYKRTVNHVKDSRKRLSAFGLS